MSIENRVDLDSDRNRDKNRDKNRDRGDYELMLNNPNTVFISPAFLHRYLIFNYRDDGDLQTNDDNKIMEKYRGIIQSKGVSAGIANRLYTVASKMIKKYKNNDKLEDLNEFNREYRKELVKYSKENHQERDIIKNVDVRSRKADIPTNDNSVKKNNYPNPYEVPTTPFEPPSPYNKKKKKE